MFNTLKSAVRDPEIRSRMLYTLLVLFIFRIGAHITVPGVNADAISVLAQSGLFGLLNTFGGGALSSFSILSLGVSPYITSSIIVQLLQMEIIPSFTEWSKQGEVGRRKLDRATRYLSIIIAFVQALGISIGFNSLANFGLIADPGLVTYLQIALVLTAGTMFSVWLGEQITLHGIGNGTSLIIFSGIIARIPQEIWQYVNERFINTTAVTNNVIFTIALGVALVILIALIVAFNQAERRIPVQYAKRASGQNKTTRLPLKLNSAGVIPVIFASSFMMVPQTILLFFTEYSDRNWYQTLTTIFDYQQPVGAAIYAILIVAFTFFYAFIQINPEKVSENLIKSGGYIPGVRPGKETESFIAGTITRLSAVGSIGLMLIALLPIIASNIWDIPSSLALGGTSILIVVGVALDTYRQIEGKLIKRRYRGFIWS